MLSGGVMKAMRTLLVFSALLLAAGPVQAAETAKTVLAGGCFWCMEADFEKLDGVTDVVSGFTGGTLPNPTYNGNHAGHLEAVEISYDPQRLSYRQLIEYYWVHIDPFDDQGQFCDKGPSYRSAVFVATPEERAVAEETRAEIEKTFKQKVATRILDATTFWPIIGDESYHQDYYKKNPLRYKYYRWNCGRDQRLEELWGAKDAH